MTSIPIWGHHEQRVPARSTSGGMHIGCKGLGAREAWDIIFIPEKWFQFWKTETWLFLDDSNSAGVVPKDPWRGPHRRHSTAMYICILLPFVLSRLAFRQRPLGTAWSVKVAYETGVTESVTSQIKLVKAPEYMFEGSYSYNLFRQSSYIYIPLDAWNVRRVVCLWHQAIPVFCYSAATNRRNGLRRSYLSERGDLRLAPVGMRMVGNGAKHHYWVPSMAQGLARFSSRLLVGRVSP